jgi:tetraacyldisaccharide 4'-kinase
MAARARAYASGLLPTAGAPVPTVAVGNLTVGGSGKTPVASWIANYYAQRGRRPGIVLRGYGADEGDVHRRLVPIAIVLERPDRVAAAREAVERGADIVVLDDAFQRLDTRRDLNIAVVSAESAHAVRWTVPAGPWREPWGALRRADVVVVTRKWAGRDAAEALTRRVAPMVPPGRVVQAHLTIVEFRGLLSDVPVEPGALTGATLLAAAGVADPEAFAIQCRRFGAVVRTLPFRDHQPFSGRQVRRLLHTGRRVDYVVVTEKDAVKLRSQWPRTEPEPIVASLGVTWERGRDVLEGALNAVAAEGIGHDPRRTRHQSTVR